MKVQVKQESSKLANQTTLTNTPIQSTLTPFDQNYTLTGLIKHIQLALTELIQAKQSSPPLEMSNQHSEVQQLIKIKEEVAVLKTIIIHNINDIFSNIYPSDQNYKKQDRTNHTLSPPTLKNQHHHQKEMTITDFQVQSKSEQLQSIKHFQVNQENITYHNNLYQEKVALNDEKSLIFEEEDGQDERSKVEKQRMQKQITPFLLPDFQIIHAIKIQQDQQEDEDLDLVCYEDQENINERKKKNKLQQSKNGKGFSPILERPVEEEQTMQKLVKNEAQITFSQGQKPIFSLTSLSEAELKKRLFTYMNRPALPQRYSRKKYNYLQKAKLK